MTTPISAEREASATTPVGHRIRARRIQLGLSQADIAEGMLSPSYVSLVESGRRQPASGALAHLAERLGVDVEYLRDGVDASVRANARLGLQRARTALQEGNPSEAYDQLAELVGDPGLTKEQQREAKLSQARALELQGDLPGALDILMELIDTARTSRRNYPWLDVAVAAARCYREVGDFARAIKIGEESMYSAEQLGMDGTDEYARLGATVLSVYKSRGDRIRPQQLAAKLIALADNIGAPQTRGAVYWNAGLVAAENGQLAKAMDLMDKARAMFGESDDQRNLVRIRIAHAMILVDVPGQAEAALSLLDQAREGVEVHGSPTDVSAHDSTRARALMLLGRLEEAREAAEEALIDLDPASRVRRAEARVTLAHVARLQGDIDTSVREGHTAAQALEEMGTSEPAAHAWSAVADLYRELGRKDDALDAFDKALRSMGITPDKALLTEQAGDEHLSSTRFT